jgi:hypothetical protein
MKRTVLFLAFVLVGLSTLKAQELSQGDKNWGLLLTLGANLNLEQSFGFSAGGGAGLYYKYAFTDVVLGELEAKYNVRSTEDLNGVFHYLDVPALCAFQISKGYIGFGGQYSYNLGKASSITNVGTLNYFAAIMEVAYISHWSGTNGWLYYDEKGYVVCCRFGYALNAIKYSTDNISNPNKNYHPFLIEALLRWNIGQYFDNGGRGSSRRRR